MFGLLFYFQLGTETAPHRLLRRLLEQRAHQVALFQLELSTMDDADALLAGQPTIYDYTRNQKRLNERIKLLRALTGDYTRNDLDPDEET